MYARSLRLLQFSLVIMDFLCINAVFFTAEYLFHIYGLIRPSNAYLQFGFLLSMIWICVSLYMNLYIERHVMSFEYFTSVSGRAYVYFLLGVIVYLFFFRVTVLSRIFIVVVLGSLPVGLLFNRMLYLSLFRYFRRSQDVDGKVIVIGYNELSKKLVKHLTGDNTRKKVLGFCEEYENIQELSTYPILSTISDAPALCRKLGVTEIYSTIAPEHNQEIYRLMHHADQNCIRFRIIPDLGIFLNRKMHVEQLGGMPMIMLRNEPLEDIGNCIHKRIADLIISSLVIVFVLSWLTPLLALLIRLESRGPVFFAQERTGKDNRVFRCLKFRSMYCNEKANQLQASRGDKRVTRIGAFLRRTSLDELPQFLNVFIGQMSIVGPRPHMVKHTDEYSRLIERYMVRQFLKPGITGWAQVKGYRGETRTLDKMEKRIEHDLWYMENWSMVLDLKILIMTILVTIKGDKYAY